MVLTGTTGADLVPMQAAIHGHEVDVGHVARIDALVARCDDLRLEGIEACLQREPVCQSVVHVSFKRRRSFWRDKEDGRDQ
jgi:hypothetical protein